MRVFVRSDIGKTREINQDAYYVSEEKDQIQLFVLADGMGGYQGGEIASSLAISSVKNYINSNFKDTPKDKENIQELIRSTVEYANMIVYEESKKDAKLEGMGTTLEVCLIYNNRTYIGHVGDSRIYRIRKHIIRKLTGDHSYVEKLVKDGTITREESYTHPKKNMLTKALGCTPFVEPDITVKGFLKGDIILLTSDGLTNMIKDDEIYEIVTDNVSKAADRLVSIANDRGGYDNITILILHSN